MAQDPVLDKTGSNNTQATIGLKKLNRMKEEFSLVDTWRSTNKKSKQYTWNDKRQIIQTRIDRIGYQYHTFGK